MSNIPRPRALVLASCLLCASGCFSFSAIAPAAKGGIADKAVKRYTFETQCPASEVRTEFLSNQELAVSGCGRRAVYLLTIGGRPGCFSDDHQYAWMTKQEAVDDLVEHCVPVLNSESIAARSPSDS